MYGEDSALRWSGTHHDFPSLLFHAVCVSQGKGGAGDERCVRVRCEPGKGRRLWSPLFELSLPS